jgi:OmpA-OmpF porin, OOP family
MMKRFWFVAIVLLSITMTSYGQNASMTKPEKEMYSMPKNGFVVRKLWHDYQSQNGGSISTFKDYRHGYELGYQRMISDKLGLRIPARYGVVDAYIDTINCIKKRIASLDLQGQYHLGKSGAKFAPYILAGVGGVIENVGAFKQEYPDAAQFNVQIPLGFGLKYQVADNAYINWQSEYRISLAENHSNLTHGIGFVYMIGKGKKKEMAMKEELPLEVDTDGDGVADKNDLCPALKGSKELNGCPDRDQDGIMDSIDKCPDIKGEKEFSGCPDSDGDGVSDNDDECPKVAGTIANKGCPETKIMDADGDGIADADDRCPNIAGTIANKGCPETKIMDADGDGVADADDKCPNERGSLSANGCPDADNDGIVDKDDKCPNKAGLRVYNGCPDSDGDGIDDSRDKCPNTAGSVANDGCPEIKQEDRKTLDVAMQAVQFQTGSAVLKSESYALLDQIADILNRYPDYNMAISGHTDNIGSSTSNQTLSEKRAKACYDYILRQGVSSARMSHEGYGESRPIATNESDRGRTLNRRVEFNLVPRQ